MDVPVDRRRDSDSDSSGTFGSVAMAAGVGTAADTAGVADAFCSVAVVAFVVALGATTVGATPTVGAAAATAVAGVADGVGATTAGATGARAGTVDGVGATAAAGAATVDDGTAGAAVVIARPGVASTAWAIAARRFASSC